MFSQINSAFALWDRFKKWHTSEPETANTAQRFIHLFEAHGVARAQIPRFLGHDRLTFHQVEDDTELLKVLDVSLLEFTSNLFNVRCDWLEGASDEMYDLIHFYKYPALFGQWLDELQNSSNVKIEGWLLTTSYFNDKYDAVIVIREPIGELSDKIIYRYYFCEQWYFDYWKCRADIAACVAQAWKRSCYISGRKFKRKIFDRIISLKFVPDSKVDGTANFTETFNAEDLTTDLDSFIQGINDGSYGAENGVARWLEYHQQDLMGAGFGDHSEKFRKYLR